MLHVPVPVAILLRVHGFFATLTEQSLGLAEPASAFAQIKANVLRANEIGFRAANIKARYNGISIRRQMLALYAITFITDGEHLLPFPQSQA